MKRQTILTIGLAIVFITGLFIATITISNQRETISKDYNKIDSLTVVLKNTNAEFGKCLFQINCGKCHPPKDWNDSYIEGIVDRVGERYLVLFLTNQDSLLKSNDRYAIELKTIWGNLPTRHNFKLSQIEMKALIEYLR